MDTPLITPFAGETFLGEQTSYQTTSKDSQKLELKDDIKDRSLIIV